MSVPPKVGLGYTQIELVAILIIPKRLTRLLQKVWIRLVLIRYPSCKLLAILGRCHFMWLEYIFRSTGWINIKGELDTPDIVAIEYDTIRKRGRYSLD